MNKLVPYALMIGMLLMALVSWKTVTGYHKNITQSYQKHIQNAQEYMQKKIYIDAVSEYENALKVKPEDYETAMIVVDLYDKLEMESEWVKACEKAISSDPKQKEPYLLLADYYKDNSKFSKSYDVLKKAKKNLADDESDVQQDEDIHSRMLELKGRYSIENISSDIVPDVYYCSEYKNGICVFSKDDKKGLATSSGAIEYGAKYDEIGVPGQNVIPIKLDGEWYYINMDGYRKLVPDAAAEYLGSFADGYAPAKINGKYGYLDKKMKQYHFEYEYAGGFANGIAAVKKDGKWGIIDSSFKTVVDFSFDSVLLDSYGFCCSQKVFWGETNGQYKLYDVNGSCLSEGYDDVKLFVSNEPAAVKKDGKWGFVDINGKEFMNPKYEDAGSFQKGYAPVKQNGLWGCITAQDEMVIDLKYDMIYPFSKNGYAIAELDGSRMYIVVTFYE